MRLPRQVLAELALVDDEEVLTDVCWALSYLGERPEGVDAVIATGVCSRLATLLGFSPTVQKSALHAVGNIVAGSQVQAQAALDGGALPQLTSLLQSNEAEVQRLAAWAISNVTAGSSDQIQAVIDEGAVTPLKQLLRSQSRAVRKEAAFALVNVTTSPWPQHTLRLVSQGVVAPLCELLSPLEPADMVTVALEGLQNILKIGESLAVKGPNAKPGEEDRKERSLTEQLLELKSDHEQGRLTADEYSSARAKAISTFTSLPPKALHKAKPGSLTCADIVNAVVKADGRSRMLALRKHHRVGAIHTIATTLLRTYFEDVNFEAAEASEGDVRASSSRAAEGDVAGAGGGARDKDSSPRAAERSRATSAAAARVTGPQMPDTAPGASGSDYNFVDALAPGETEGDIVTSSSSSLGADDLAATSASGPTISKAGHRVEFVVTIDKFSQRQNLRHPAGQYSKIFDGKAAGRWRLLSYTHGTVAGKDGEWLSLYVSSADVDELACQHRWSRTVDYSITLLHPSHANGKAKPDGTCLHIKRRHTSVVFRGIHNDYEWGCRDFLPSDQVSPAASASLLHRPQPPLH